MKKRIFILILATVLMLSFASCRNNDTGTPDVDIGDNTVTDDGNAPDTQPEDTPEQKPEPVAPHEHSTGELVTEVITAPSCTSEGKSKNTIYCIDCGEKITHVYADIDMLPHTPSDPVTENEQTPACGVVGGYDTVVYCTVCDGELSREHTVLDGVTHTPADSVIENSVAASCTSSGGYDTVIYCELCGTEMSRDHVTVDALPHTPSEPVTENEQAPACGVEGGYDTVVYCSICAAQISREHVSIDALSHIPSESVIENEQAPACGVDGGYDTVIYCTVCGGEISREHTTIDGEDHNPAAPVIENEKAATCGADGGYDTVIYCTLCGGEVSREHTAYDRPAHKGGTSVVENDVDSTCNVEGGFDWVVYCTVCGDELSRIHKSFDKLEHIPGASVIENSTMATCTTDASCERVVYCSVCDTELSRTVELIPVMGHQIVGGICDICGICTDDYYVRDGKYIYFGEFPQTLKADDVTVTGTCDSRGYFLGSDGCYYAMVVAEPYLNTYTFSNGEDIVKDNVYYFKVEPIRWKILTEKHGVALLVCDSIIANMAYDSGEEGTCDYATSEIRAWLNGVFYETAFTELERSIITATSVDNSAQSTGVAQNPNAANNTVDKVFLLSIADITSASNGYIDAQSADVARRKQTSDYSRAIGAGMSTSDDYYGNGWWWTRSPHNQYNTLIREVNASGDAFSNLTYVTATDSGIVPAIRVVLY